MTYLILTLALLAGIALLGAVNPPAIKGISTIVWGTEGQLGSPSGAIVESIAITPKNPASIGEIENGDGAVVSDILLDDGFDAKITCVYDKSKTWPALGGAPVLLSFPSPTGAGGISSVSCYLAGIPEVNTSRKKEATITLTLRYRPGISS